VKLEKIFPMRLHLPLMSMSADVIAAKATPGEATSEGSRTGALSFEDIYAQWFHDVSRWIRAFGGFDADLDDLAQEVFLIVRRQLPKFDGQNLGGWLYRITQRTVRDYRRRAWYRRVLARQHVDGRPERESTAPEPDPSEMLERREAERFLVQILAKMTESRRTAFILFEIEGYTGEEIASLEEVPVNTVWTRLHHARKEFYMLIDRARTQGRLR
jgi:RNA polymerase sigma-70 factor (ECF subfamily)